MKNHSNAKKIIAAKKAKSLLDKITQMIEANEYCIDIMQQNLAVIGILKNLNKTLMEDHLNHCFKNAIASNNKNKQQTMIQEILAVSHLSNK
jgi:DNA-binding FrmR family transcriptional regulator